MPVWQEKGRESEGLGSSRTVHFFLPNEGSPSLPWRKFEWKGSGLLISLRHVHQSHRGWLTWTPCLSTTQSLTCRDQPLGGLALMKVVVINFQVQQLNGSVSCHPCWRDSVPMTVMLTLRKPKVGWSWLGSSAKKLSENWVIRESLCLLYPPQHAAFTLQRWPIEIQLSHLNSSKEKGVMGKEKGTPLLLSTLLSGSHT